MIAGVSAAPVLIMLMMLAVVNVSCATIGRFAVAIVHNRDVADAAWGWAISCAGSPAVGVDAACKDRRTIADGIESVEVGVVIAAATVVVVAVTVGVIAPLGIAGADENRARVTAPPAVMAGTVSSAIGCADRCKVGVVVTGGECGGCDHHCDDCTKTDVFDHVCETT